MKKYIKYFKVPFIIIAVLLAIYASLMIVKSLQGEKERTNTVHTDTQRVFDYADVLTDSEEAKLEALIAKRQKQIACDIVLVTINEPYEGYSSPESYVMNRADDFYDEQQFGYDGPNDIGYMNGDGILYLDNWCRDYDGYAYCWLSASGRCEKKYSNDMINDLIDLVTENSNSDPYGSYVDYVNQVARDMTGSISFNIPIIFVFAAAFIIALVFFISKISNKKGVKTTTNRTYIVDGFPRINNAQDNLYDKKVVSRVIQTSSSGGGSGGGGGHHTSSGGHSHGGGGGRH